MILLSSMNVVGDEDGDQEMLEIEKKEQEEHIAREEKIKKMCQNEVEKGTVRSLDECYYYIEEDLNPDGTQKGIVFYFITSYCFLARKSFKVKEKKYFLKF